MGSIDDLKREANELNVSLRINKDILINGCPSPQRRDEIWSGVEKSMARLKDIEATLHANR